MVNKKTVFVAIMITLLYSCAGIPKTASAVEQFEPNRYLGTWYEIARFDYRFERNMNNVTAQYSLNENGTIKVYNRGYDYVNAEWESATGKAKFRNDSTTAELKVSFFGPFYAGYNVIAIDAGYNYALVAGSSLDYLWILSRTPTIPGYVKEAYLKKAEEIGYETAQLIWVEHNQLSPAEEK